MWLSLLRRSCCRLQVAHVVVCVDRYDVGHAPGPWLTWGKPQHIVMNRAAISKNADIADVWGIGRRLSKKLREIGINSAFELSRLDPRLAGNNFSVVLEKTIRELRGESCINLNNINEPKKQIIVSRSFGRGITSKSILHEAISFHANRAAEKLRHEKQKCRYVKNKRMWAHKNIGI